MAAVLDAMTPYVIQLIAGMAQEEVNTLLGVSSEIKKLEDHMRSLKCFLADAERTMQSFWLVDYFAEKQQRVSRQQRI
jgi:hypothetical protein